MSDSGTAAATEVAVLTATGRSAIAVIVVNGPQALAAVDRYFLAANRRRLESQPLGRIVYGRWGEETGEDLVVCRPTANQVEIHCHGSRPSIEQIVQQLTAAGCSQVEWRQWVKTQHDSLLKAEAHTALADACTLRTAAILLDQYQGAFQTAVAQIKTLLSQGAAREAEARLRELLEYVEFGKHLTQPWRVVLAGYPNVGKSSLVNAMVGYQRAIVFDQPGTTRDVVSVLTAIEGWPLQISDTAGLRRATDALESAGIVRTQEELQSVDLIVWVVDASTLDKHLLAMDKNFVRTQLNEIGAQVDAAEVLLVVNKKDLSAAAILGAETLATCALTGEGVGELLAAIVARLVPSVPPAGSAVPFTGRQALLLQTAVDHCQRDELAASAAALERILSGG